MKYDIERFSRSIATVGTFFAFGFYLIYHFAVANLGLPRFLSGYFSPMITAFAAIVLLIQILRPSLTITKEDVGVYFMSACMLALSLGYFALGNTVQSNARYVTLSLETLWIFFSTYVVVKNAYLNSVRLKKFVIITLIIQLFLIIYIGIADGKFALSSMSGDDTAMVAGYQQVAMVLLFLLGFTMANAGSAWRPPIYALGLVALFYNGARTEFVGFLIAGFVLLSRSFLKRYVSSTLYVIGTFTVITLGSLYANIFESDSRTISILDLLNQSSYEERSDLFRNAIICVQDSPIMGCYGEDRILGEGSYSHNALSAWQIYGLPIFIIYTATFLYKLLNQLRNDKSISSLKDFSIYFYVIAIFCMLFSKHFLDVIIAISFAVMSNMQMTRRKLSRSKVNI